MSRTILLMTVVLCGLGLVGASAFAEKKVPHSAGASAPSVPELSYSGRRAAAVRPRHSAPSERTTWRRWTRYGRTALRHVSYRCQLTEKLWSECPSGRTELAPASSQSEDGVYPSVGRRAVPRIEESGVQRRQEYGRATGACFARQACPLGLESGWYARSSARAA